MDSWGIAWLIWWVCLVCCFIRGQSSQESREEEIIHSNEDEQSGFNVALQTRYDLDPILFEKLSNSGLIANSSRHEEESLI